MGRRYLFLSIAILAFAGVALAQDGVRWFWFNDGEDPPEMPLLDSCGFLPVPDGTVVSIFWDQNSDGPDPNDPQPPLCNNPPDCWDGPAGTVNFIDFQMDGPGGYFTSPVFRMIGASTPPRFFLRVCYGSSLWQSSVVTIVPGLHQIVPSLYSFACLPLPCPGCSAPPPPSDFTASYGLCSGVTLNWTYPDSITDIAGFKLFRNGSLMAVVPVDSAYLYDDSAAPEGESAYGIQVRRFCLQDSVFSPLVTENGMRVPLPPMPFDVHASDSFIGCVYVTWMYGTNNGLDHWVVRRNQIAVGEVAEHGASPGLRSFVDHPILD